MIDRYPTLRANAEQALSAVFQRCEDVERLKAQEEAAYLAVSRVYQRRMNELRTSEEMKNRRICGNR